MLKSDNTSCFSIRIPNEDLQPMNSFLLRQRYCSLGISSKSSLSCLPTTTLINTLTRINDSDYPADSIDSSQNLLFHPERLISRLHRASSHERPARRNLKVLRTPKWEREITLTELKATNLRKRHRERK